MIWETIMVMKEVVKVKEKINCFYIELDFGFLCPAFRQQWHLVLPPSVCTIYENLSVSQFLTKRFVGLCTLNWFDIWSEALLGWVVLCPPFSSPSNVYFLFARQGIPVTWAHFLYIFSLIFQIMLTTAKAGDKPGYDEE